MFSSLKNSELYKKAMPAIRTSILYKFAKKANAEVAIFLNDKVTESFFVIGVTGTNGKTTTANLIGHICNQKVAPTVTISSVYTKIKDQVIPHKKRWEDFTIFDIYNILNMAKDNGCQMAVIEISGAGLRKYAYEGIKFDAAVLTNITHDHVHQNTSFHEYEQSKKELFRSVLRNSKTNKFAVFPSDDRIGRQRFTEMPFDKKISYSVNSSSVLKAENVQVFLNGTMFTFNYLGHEHAVKTPLLGTFNVQNILAALGLAFEIGLSAQDAVAAIQTFQPVQGRMERITHNNRHHYFDISHSPDALDKSLQFIAHAKGAGRAIVVFGTPGGKDKAKREDMGRIVERYGDIIIATDGEPGHENRLQILDDLTGGITHKKEGENFFVIPNRQFAIQFALDIARDNDVILFTGRPRHGYQKTNTGKVNRNDMDFVKGQLGL